MKHEELSTPVTEPVIEIENLRIEARANDEWIEIVKGINVSLKPGEVLGLVGESGAGKSTIGLAALGFFKPGLRVVEGKVMFGGQDLLTIPEPQRRPLRGTEIAYVAQSAAAAFNPSQRLIDQITGVAVKRGGLSRTEAEARAVELFRAMRLPEPETFGRRYPHQVSGGQLQRAMTAMAMISRPKLIVFDEPTTALDVTTQVEVLVSVKEAIRDFGVSALYISHDLAVVAQMADRVAVLRYGEVVEEAPIAEIIDAPKHPYTQTLWAVRNLHGSEKETASEPLLSVRNLDVAYGTKPVLSGINLEVGTSQTVALVGESGSGKSTLGRVIVGLKDAMAGSVTYKGKELGASVHQRDKDLLKQIQIIYQSAETALNPRHTVRKILGRPVGFYHGLRGRKREERILELLRMVEMDESHIDRYPGQLSGGQRQRIAIARALAAGPELIVCDEVTSALDQVVQADILRMLQDLQDRLGVSYLFITHDIDVVQAIADRVVVMNKGQIVEDGPKHDIFAPPHAEYTEELLSSVPKMSVTWLDETIAARR